RHHPRAGDRAGRSAELIGSTSSRHRAPSILGRGPVRARSRRSSSHPRTRRPRGHMIRFEQANVTYPGGVSAMRDLDLEIGDGEFVVIVGLSGAGKSTLIRAINGLVPLTSGKLEVNGHDVPSLNRRGLRALRSEVGMIFQGFNLVDRTTVLNNVLMGRLHNVATWRTLIGRYPAEDVQIAA